MNVGLWRRDGEGAERLPDERFREGDLLVLLGRATHCGELAAYHGLLMWVPFVGETRRRIRAPLARVILCVRILADVLEWLPAPLA